MKKYLLAHDLGTSGNKATLFSVDGEIVASATYSYDVKWYNNLWAEQNPKDWYRAVCETTKEVLNKVVDGEVIGISFSGQMMGCLCVDKNGKPLADSIIWADMRSEEEADFIKNQIDENSFYHITGHRASASNSLAKLLWIKNNKEDIYNNTYKMLNAKDYIIFKLTGNFVTDYSDASGTNLLDLTALKWSEEIATKVGINLNKMPDLKKSTDIVGYITEAAAKEIGLEVDIPVICGGGDGSMAAVGAGCISSGTAFSSIGTSGWNAITTNVPIYDSGMRTFNFVHIVPGKYVPCGTMQTVGAAISWMIEQFADLEKSIAKDKGESVYTIIEDLISQVKIGSNGVIFLPYLQGERSPWWNSKAKGSFIGLTMTTDHKIIFRSVYEGIAMNLGIILDIMGETQNLDYIVLTGGGARSATWCQIFADIYNIPIHVPSNMEITTSVGAAVTAGVGLGIYENFEVVNRFIKIDRVIKPNIENVNRYKKLKKIFVNSYKTLENIYEDLTEFMEGNIGNTNEE